MDAVSRTFVFKEVTNIPGGLKLVDQTDVASFVAEPDDWIDVVAAAAVVVAAAAACCSPIVGEMIAFVVVVVGAENRNFHCWIVVVDGTTIAIFARERAVLGDYYDVKSVGQVI